MLGAIHILLLLCRRRDLNLWNARPLHFYVSLLIVLIGGLDCHVVLVLGLNLLDRDPVLLYVVIRQPVSNLEP